MTDTPIIVLATANPHKVEELLAILGPSVRLRSLIEATGGRVPPEPAEHGLTFEANARIKASAYARAVSSWCLADDSGLEVDALSGAPGVVSSHYSTDGVETGLPRAARDARNNARLLGELEGTPAERRAARFVCVMALANPSGEVVAVARGTFEGRIGCPPRVPSGLNGFGYDPLFLLPAPDDRTSAELSPEEKNGLSHRGQAARRIAAQIRSLA